MYSHFAIINKLHLLFLKNFISINELFCSLEVLVTLTSDVGKILASLHRVQSKGEINFLTAVKIAHVSAKEVGNEIYSVVEFVR